MHEALPFFPYHPDPIATGAIKISDAKCICCDKCRGYIYEGTMYSLYRGDVALCPWCISDGAAAKKFKATFNDANWLISKGIPRSIVNVVNKRTPSYCSWQEVVWLSHCNDACEFHGEATVEDVRGASSETISLFVSDDEEYKEHFLREIQGFTGEGEIVLYKYICRSCKLMLFGYEYS